MPFERVFRPVSGDRLRKKCFQMLHMEGNDSEQNAEQKERKKVRRRILVVDDSAMVLRNIKSILEEEYDVFLATSGRQAIKMIPEKEPDLVLLDYGMPGWDGRETFEKIKESPEYGDIPVVFLTGVAQRSQIYAVLKNRPAGYILKPPDQEKIIATIREVLGE
jgi:CheY-like chemotaxis protein